MPNIPSTVLLQHTLPWGLIGSRFEVEELFFKPAFRLVKFLLGLWPMVYCAKRSFKFFRSID